MMGMEAPEFVRLIIRGHGLLRNAVVFQISKVNDVDGGSYNYLIKKLMNEQMMMLSIQFDSIPYIACITVFLQSSIYKHTNTHKKNKQPTQIQACSLRDLMAQQIGTDNRTRDIMTLRLDRLIQ